MRWEEFFSEKNKEEITGGGCSGVSCFIKALTITKYQKGKKERKRQKKK